jgi:hypothetical protein
LQRILKFSSHKVLRLIEILSQYGDSSELEGKCNDTNNTTDSVDNLETITECNATKIDSVSPNRHKIGKDSINDQGLNKIDTESNVPGLNESDNASNLANEVTAKFDALQDDDSDDDKVKIVTFCENGAMSVKKICSPIKQTIPNNSAESSEEFTQKTASSIVLEEKLQKQLNTNITTFSKLNISSSSNISSTNTALFPCDKVENCPEISDDTSEDDICDFDAIPSTAKKNTMLKKTECTPGISRIVDSEITSNIKSEDILSKSKPNVSSINQRPITRSERRFQRGSPRKYRRQMPTPLCIQGTELEPLCGMVFVTRRFTAQVLYHLLNNVRQEIPELKHIAPQYTASLGEDGEVKDIEKEHRKQEEVLKRLVLHI